MGLLDVLRAGVKVADGVTKPLQATVSYERHISTTGDGTKTYAAVVLLRAIVDYRAKHVRTSTGVMTVTHAVIDLLDVAALNLATDNNGVGTEDRFTLPSGHTGQVLDVAGFVDAGTTRPVATTVMLG